MFNCRDCEKLLYPFLDRELDAGEQAQVREHLEFCGSCDDRFRFEGNILRAIGEIARKGACPDEARVRILRACGKATPL